jgi:membrane protease YdiL (CAAX protease family)
MVELANVLLKPAQGLTSRLKSPHIEIPKNALFGSLTRQQLRLVLPHVKVKKYKAGRVLLQEGARNPGKVYIVIDGQISLTKQGVSPLDGRVADYELSLLRRSDIFGEVSFVDGKPSRTSFSAKTPVTVAVLDLSGSRHRNTTRRVRDVVEGKLRHRIAELAGESTALRMNGLHLENQLSAYRTGVGHLVVATLCLLSFYTMTLGFLPAFRNVTHANFTLSPLIILLFALTFVPVIATSGFPRQFFGLQLDNWRPALALSLKASAVFLAVFLIVKWMLINTSPSLAGVPLIDNAEVEVQGHPASTGTWYWFALGVYLLLTPMQEFVARSGIQAPLHAFLQGSETKRCWASILASNLVFSAAHAHISLAFAIAAFLPGLLWGWLFAKTNSLFAATVSHLIVGSCAIFLFGIEGLVSRLAV